MISTNNTLLTANNCNVDSPYHALLYKKGGTNDIPAVYKLYTMTQGMVECFIKDIDSSYLSNNGYRLIFEMTYSHNCDDCEEAIIYDHDDCEDECDNEPYYHDCEIIQDLADMEMIIPIDKGTNQFVLNNDITEDYLLLELCELCDGCVV